MKWHIESVANAVVTTTETTAAPDCTILHLSRGRLRFLDQPTLNQLLEAADFTFEHQFGDFTRAPITHTSRSIVTVANATFPRRGLPISFM